MYTQFNGIHYGVSIQFVLGGVAVLMEECAGIICSEIKSNVTCCVENYGLSTKQSEGKSMFSLHRFANTTSCPEVNFENFLLFVFDLLFKDAWKWKKWKSIKPPSPKPDMTFYV